ncbi:MAG: response regulator [Bacteroidia bacterium]|nr:response regulator [Bacteroidia bacterium]
MTKKINTVLLIDDDPMANLNNERILAKSNLVEKIYTAESALEALELLELLQIKSGQFPDLILLDINMPNLNGWDFIEHYKMLEGLKAKTKIILLAVNPDETDLQRANKIPEVAGFKMKPITEELIIELIH